jgi:hypothetical protein
MDPFHVHNARIPDMVTDPSNVVYQYQVSDVQGDAFGRFAFAFNPTQLTANGVGLGWYIPMLSTSAVSIIWGTAVSAPSAGTLSTLVWKFRCVSAALCFVPQAAVNSASGLFSVALLPTALVATTPQTSVSYITTGNMSATMPAVDSWQAVWLPMDYSTFDYQDVTDATNKAENMLYVFGGGLPVNTVLGRLFMIANYEVIPLTAAAGILPALRSYSNVTQLERAANSLGAWNFVSRVAFEGSALVGSASAASTSGSGPGLSSIQSAMSAVQGIASRAASSSLGKSALNWAASSAVQLIARHMKANHPSSRRIASRPLVIEL